MPTMIEEETLVDKELEKKLDKMKILPRGSFKPKKDATNPENCKVKISMYLDGDIVEYFRQRAEDPNSAPYQTQINNELRNIMENDLQGKPKLDESILEDKEFLQALKEKLEMV